MVQSSHATCSSCKFIPFAADHAEALIGEINRLSRSFTTPAGACPTYHRFYDGLKDFEQDIHQHIHLENNILFPRAIDLEAFYGPASFISS
jgi:iron-sulfur cluster repair protein YtfE (RIC family)